MFKVPKIALPLKGVSYLIFIVLLNSIAATMLVPIFPIYIKQFVSSNAVVGYITAFISLLLILYTLLIRKLLLKIKKINLIRWGFIGSSVTLLLLIIISNIKQFLILEVFRTFFLVAVYLSMGLFVREYTSLKNIGRAEGQYFTISNVGWLLGPLIGGLLATAYSFNTVFILSAIPQFLLGLILFIIPLKESEAKHSHDFNLLDYFKNKELITLYIIEFGFIAWWIILYTYMPLYADTNGFSTKIIGYAMFAAVIPLVLLEIPLGKLADDHGFKKYIFLGFLIMALIMLLTYFTDATYTIILIVIATIGATFIEPLTEAYFFRKVKTKEGQRELYPVYKTSPEISKLITPLIFSTILIYWDFKGLFLFTAIFMFSFALFALRLKK